MNNLKSQVTGGLVLGLASVGLAFLSIGCSDSEADSKSAAKRISVRLVPLEERVFEDRVEVDGSIEAKTSALVTPRLDGTIEAIYVDEGESVVAGETKLFAIDQLKLEQAVEVARQVLAVTRCGTLEKQANLERFEVILKKAEIDYHRQKELLEAEEIGTKDQVEQLESGYLQAKASVKHAQTLVDLAREQERQTEASLAMAEKDLRDAVVVAPISGVISRRHQDVGDRGSPGRPVFRIDDTEDLEVSVFLPSRYYARVKVGITDLQVRVEGQVLGAFPVSYKSPTIDPTLRVFEVKCALPNQEGRVVPGQLASVRMALDRRQGLAIPREAVGQRGQEYVVYRVDGELARMTLVQLGLENDGWVELTQTDLAPGTGLVTEGRFLLEDGAPVQVVASEK